MPSSPEFRAATAADTPTGTATAWRLEELRPGNVALRRPHRSTGTGGATATEVGAAPLFEIARDAGIPDDLLAEARAAAQAAGYAAGWANGIQAARLLADAESRAARAEHERTEAAHAEQVRRAVSGLDLASTVLEQRAVPAAEQIENLIVDAAFAIAEALVGRALADDATRGRAAVRRALALAPDGEEVTVRVSGVDYAVLTGDGAEPVNATGNRIVHLVRDESLEPGDAIATCGATTVDARLAAGLRRVKELLAP